MQPPCCRAPESRLEQTGNYMSHHDPTRAKGRAPHSSVAWSVLPDDDQVRGVYQFIYRHVGNREEAEALTERACVRAMQMAPRDPPHGPDRRNTDSALRQAARSVIEEHLRWFYRRSFSSPQAAEVDMLPEFVAEEHGKGASAADRAGRILAQLSARERELLMLRFFRHASLAETGAQMGLSPDDALALQWRALGNAARLMASERMQRSPSVTCSGGSGSGTDQSTCASQREHA